MALKPYLQLVRLPNVFTAAADSLAGWLLVQGTLREPARWLPLCLASVLIYAAGIALNDYFDFAIDQIERPSRPLPTGRVSRRFALFLGIGMMAAGVALVALSSPTRSTCVAVLLIMTVLAYDLVLKHTPIGPIAMGACRGLNLLLGLSAAADLGGSVGWLAAGSFGLFVAGVTWISRSETQTGKSAGPVLGWAFQNLALFGLFAVAMQAARFPTIDGVRPPIVPLEGLLVLLVVAWVVNAATGRALRLPTPLHRQMAVKTGVLALVWLDVGLVAAVRGPVHALAVAALWVPAFLLGKWLYST
ncbi:MAG: UbiA family prenyltransferase [Isosphaeraceae bacterium]